MKLSWNTLSRSEWEAHHVRWGGSLQQAWAYGQAMQRLGIRVERAAVRDAAGEVQGLAQFICRRVAFYIGLSACTRGPLWSPAAPAALRAQALRALQREMPVRPLRVTLVSPDCAPDALLPGETAGLSRVLTGYSTVMLDLTQGMDALRAQLDGKWRNRLVKAEAEAGLRIQVQADRQACQELLRREGEQRQSRGFHGLPTELVEAYLEAHDSPAQAHLMAVARRGRYTLAAMLFLQHGRVATYHLGWAGEEGRSLNLHNLLLWRALEKLSERGITQLDLGGVNTRELPGISRFKLGTGGQVLTLAGTYF